VSDDVPALVRQLPDTPAGRQLAWWLAMLADEGAGASAADWDRYAPELRARLGPLPTAEAMSAAWRANAARLGAPVELALESADAHFIVATLGTAKDRRWMLSLAVEPASPHRMMRFEIERRHDFKLDVREATAADAAILADIERRCPIVLGDTEIRIDRGRDYLASTRLMEDCTIGIASVDGVPAAVSCGAEHRVRVGGVMKQMVTVSHLRVLPEHQRKGLWGAANRVLAKYWDHVDGSNAYISVDNTGMQHGFANTPNKWSQIVLRAQLDCAALAGPPVGRPAAPADAADIAERLNAFHGEEEMFVPYTAEAFSARMTRAADLYGWERVWMTGGAVVGVWPAGEAMKVITQRAGTSTQQTCGVVLDYGFEPGAEAEFEALLRTWCGWMAERGMDTLSIFTSPASPGVGLLRSLARAAEGFFMWTPGIAEPEGAKDRGLYVDAVYF